MDQDNITAMTTLVLQGHPFVRGPTPLADRIIRGYTTSGGIESDIKWLLHADSVVYKLVSASDDMTDREEPSDPEELSDLCWTLPQIIRR